MTRRSFAFVLASMLAVLGVTFIAVAQPAAPTVTAKPTAAPSAAPRAGGSAAPSARASSSALASASAAPSSAPSGSASAAPLDEPPMLDPHGGNPHAMDPHGGGRPQAPAKSGEFTPPEDESREDLELAPGTIILTVVDKDGYPVPDLPVTMRHDHASIAKGDTHDTRSDKTDAKGEIRYDDLLYGAAETYWIRASVGEAIFALRPLQLSQKAGGRALLHVYDATEERELLAIELQSQIRTSLREDVIVVEQEYRISNGDPVAWLADVEIPLPEGWKAFTSPTDSMGAPIRIYRSEKGAVLRGTVPPGLTGVSFGYHIPLAGDEKQSFEVQPFPSTSAVQILSEASRKMTLVADEFAPAVFNKSSGVTILVTQRIVKKNEPMLPSFKVTLGGLPTRGPGGYIALGLAIVALAVAGAYRWSRKGRTDLEPDTLKDLVEARDTLIEEITALEIAHKKGVVGPKTYERSRGLLLDALARIVSRIEASGAPALTR